MELQKYYLKATDEQALWEAMETAGLAFKFYDPFDPDNIPPEPRPEDWEPTGPYTWETQSVFDPIGTIYAQTGPALPDGELSWEPIDNFYYANLKANLTDAQVAALPTIATPSTPYRVWLGDE